LTSLHGRATFNGLFPNSCKAFSELAHELEISVPNIKSAKKDLRKSRAAAIRNRAQRSALRTAVKRARTTAAVDADRLSAVSLLDRAARKGLIHRNTAARQKSRLAKLAAAGTSA